MHELSVAVDVCRAVIEAASKNHASSVKSVELELGECTMINQEQLSFCFKVAAEGTLAEGAELNIVNVPPAIRCECGYRGTVNTDQHHIPYELAFDLRCPKCGNCAAELVSGREISVKNIRIEVDENA